MPLNKELFTSNKKYWETPQALFNELDREFHFTLDAAASDKNHKCPKYYTEADDGLLQDWAGETVFLQSTVRKCGDWNLDEKML